MVSSDAEAATPRQRPAALPGVLFAPLPWALFLLVAAWCTAAAGPFQFDDYLVIVDNPAVHGLVAWWRAPIGIRPLLKLSYALNWQLAPHAAAFHLVNLALHFANAWLAWRCLRRLLPDARAAAIAALLWALHPADTEAITYVCGRSMSLMMLFWLLALHDFLAERAAWRTALWTALALAVRETAWALPLCLALAGLARGWPAAACLKKLMPASAVVVMAAVIFLADPAYHRLLDFSLGIRGTGVQLRTQLNVLAYFLTGPVLGLTPNFDPGISLQTTVTTVWLARLALLLAVVLAAVLALWRRGSPLAAGLLWFLLALLPTCGAIPRLDLASDHHLYAALLGPAWAAGMLLAHRRLPLVLALALLLAAATLIRNEDYRSETALWLRTSQQSPGKARVWNNLGWACQQESHPDCARVAYGRALALDPADSRTKLNLYFLDKAR